MMNRYSAVAWDAVAVAALCFGAWLTFLAPSAAEPAAPVATRANALVRPFDRALGNPAAPVVLIEYASPTCPHCAEFHRQYFQSLKSKYIDTGKVRFVYRIYMLRPDDAPAEKLSRCLPAEHYFDFIGLLFQKQSDWDADIYPNVNMKGALIQIARSVGLTKERAEKCMADTALDKQLNQVSEEAEKKYKVDGTPTFVVDDVADEAGEQWAHLQNRLAAAVAAKRR